MERIVCIESAIYLVEESQKRLDEARKEYKEAHCVRQDQVAPVSREVGLKHEEREEELDNALALWESPDVPFTGAGAGGAWTTMATGGVGAMEPQMGHMPHRGQMWSVEDIRRYFKSGDEYSRVDWGERELPCDGVWWKLISC
ncbi:hypothetical protein B0H16DRAFT_1466718 [Mycena metata]|uniref:Uncharacterized protein n=1 Tax=Mycena metata TaxID=1033252 RepID=A0AAD7I895_9AGAR|nr:hypothetical protein B0H16DRAFT_1466718 [Mycena metata]